MAEEAKKASHQTGRAARGLAERNAEFWLWGRGIGGIGSVLGPLGIEHPLGGFFGRRLFDAITMVGAGGKRRHALVEAADDDDDVGDDDDRRRRVRQRTLSQDNALVVQEEGLSNSDLPLDMDLDANIDNDNDLEIGRNAPTPLDPNHIHDLSSSMPWNIMSAAAAARSRQTSLSRGRVSSLGPLILGGGGASLSSATPLHGLGYHRGSSRSRHLVSASPLNNRHASSRARSLSRQASIMPLDFGQEGEGEGEADFTLPARSNSDDEYVGGGGGRGEDREAGEAGTETQQLYQRERERFGPAAQVSTQTAAESQWVREAMDVEAGNFLAFVETALDELDLRPSLSEGHEARAILDGDGKRDTEGDQVANDQNAAEEGNKPEENLEERDPNTLSKTRSIAFHTLLPPRENTTAVAAQGLLHVLALAMRGLLFVGQEVPFGEIRLGVVGAAGAGGAGGVDGRKLVEV